MRVEQRIQTTPVSSTLSLAISLLVAIALWGCPDPPEQAAPGRDMAVDATPPEDAMVVADVGPPASDLGAMDMGAPDAISRPPPMEGVLPERVEIFVQIDGEPAVDVLVVQAGTDHTWRTDEEGWVVADVDAELDGDVVFVASHPEARVRAAELWWDSDLPLQIQLRRFMTNDNPEYFFQDPGEPTRRADTSKCAHCHETINEAWFDSPHRKTAKNPTVQDLYAGTAAAFDEEARCVDAGGRWVEGITPGTRAPEMRCFLGDGVLPTLNPECGDGACPDATQFGACADCHAPGIDGELGGRDLLEATGFAYDFGVFCNVCHQVESVELDAAPGVAGRLRIVRPSEVASPVLGAGGFLPLTFGPSHDSPNPRMGNVQRDHFHDASICAGCHQQEQAVLVPGAQIDRARWPDGRLPVHSTYQEWKTGALKDATRCQSCHMAPDPTVDNGADLQLFPRADVGIQGGWHRPPGFVRRHDWVGPRAPDSGMLQLAAGLFVRWTLDQGRLEASVTVKNAACGHGLPTGEPMRSVILLVDASCGDTPLVPVGGDAVPDFGGYLLRRAFAEGWQRWPGARPGDLIRVVRRPGEWHDYDGFEPFSRDGFSPADRGMAVEHVAGTATVVSVEKDVVALDHALPAGDVAYLIRPSDDLLGFAGAAGFAFARVMVGADGARMVPHFAAVDVASDNRLLPQQTWTTTHLFADACATPRVHARLVYRPYPLALAKARGWEMEDQLMTEVTR